MSSINEDGKLSDEQEEQLGNAIAEMIDDFGPDFDAEGNELEAGESDRIRDEEHRRTPSEHVADEEAEGADRAADEEEAAAV
jgi:hypothetical protein